jgi:hypothetical protein
MKASFPKGLISKKCETEKNEKNVLKVYFLFNRFKPLFLFISTIFMCLAVEQRAESSKTTATT